MSNADTPKEVKVEAHPGLVVKENESLTLNCKAKSYPLVTAVTWTKMTNGMSESTRSNVTTFTVKPVGVSDSGWYSCAAQNQIGTGTSERVEVQVKCEYIYQVCVSVSVFFEGRQTGKYQILH